MGINASETLAKYGHLRITNITIFRRPIMNEIMTIMNVITMGEATKRLKESEYDKLFHLGCLIQLENNKIIEVDKQQTIKIREFKTREITKNNEYMEVPITNVKTLGQLIHNTINKMGEKRFYEYDGRKINCQDFMINLINANGLGTRENNAFIKQDTEFLFKKQNILERLMRASTDTIGTVERTYLEVLNWIAMYHTQMNWKILQKILDLK
jgi:hypothetical protein